MPIYFSSAGGVNASAGVLLLRLPVGRGGVINSPRSIFLGFFSVSEVGLPLMGDTAGTKLHEPIKTRRLTAEYVNKTCILTCILQNLNRKKVLRERFSCKIFYNDKFYREALARGDESR